MSVLFSDVKRNVDIKRKLEENRVPGANFDEVLYADDTILVSTDTRTINLFLKEIEEQGEQIGLKLNRGNTEVIVVGKNKNAKITFKDGTPVKQVSDATYLGVQINDKADPNKELRLRISNTMSTWKKDWTILQKGKLHSKIQNTSISCSHKSEAHVWPRVSTI